MNNPSHKSPLEQYLTSAYISLQPPTPSPLLTESLLLSCHSLLSTSSSPVTLSSPILNKLNRISHHPNIFIQFLLGDIYILLFNYPPTTLFPPSSSSSALLITFINQSMHLHSILKQTSLNYKYLHSLQHFISTVLSTTSYTFTSSQQNTLQHIHNTNNDIQRCSTLASSFNTSLTFENGFVKHLYDTLTSTTSLHEQYTLLTSNINVIDKLIRSITFTTTTNNDEHSNSTTALYETYFDLGKLLLLFFPNKHNITYLAKSTPSHADTNHTMHFIYDDSDISHAEFLHKQQYTLYIDEDIQHQRNMLIPVILTYTQQLSTYPQKDFPVHYLRYTLLKRIFLNDNTNNNDNLLTQLTSTLLYIIQTFPNNNDEIKHFITLILRNQNEYFTKLKQHLHNALQNVDSALYTSTYVDDNDVNDDNDVYHEDLCLLNYDYKHGVFERIDVQAGETYTFYVYLQRKRALLDLCFALDSKDVNVRVTSISPEGTEHEVVNATKLLANDTPMKLLMYNNKRVVYKIQFDNSYSWFNNKVLQIKCNTFYPHSEHAVNQRINAIRLRHELMQTKTNDIANNSDNNKLIIVNDKIYSCYYVKDNVDKVNTMITNGSVKVYAVYIDKARMMFYGDDYTTQYTLNVNEFAKQVNAFLSKDKNAFSVVNVCDVSSSNNNGDRDVKEVLGFNVDEMFNSDECLFFYYKCIHYAVVYDVYQCLLSGIKYDKVIHINCCCCGTGNQYEMALYTNHDVKVYYSNEVSTIIEHVTKASDDNVNYINDVKVFICCNNTNNNNNTCNGYSAVHSGITSINSVNTVNVDVIKINDTVSYWNELKVIAPVLLIDNV